MKKKTVTNIIGNNTSKKCSFKLSKLKLQNKIYLER